MILCLKLTKYLIYLAVNNFEQLGICSVTFWYVQFFMQCCTMKIRQRQYYRIKNDSNQELIKKKSLGHRSGMTKYYPFV